MNRRTVKSKYVKAPQNWSIWSENDENSKQKRDNNWYLLPYTPASEWSAHTAAHAMADKTNMCSLFVVACYNTCDYINVYVWMQNLFWNHVWM